MIRELYVENGVGRALTETINRFTNSERQAVIDHAAHVFAFGSADYTVWQKLRCVTAHWEKIDALLRRPGPQAVVLRLSGTSIETFP